MGRTNFAKENNRTNLVPWIERHFPRIGRNQSSIVAAGNNQGTATVISRAKNRVDTVAPGTGVKENVAGVSGATRTVFNNGANDLKWYPFGTNKFYINGSGLLGAGEAIVIAPGNQASYVCFDDGELTLQ